ncbi:hypothetical protein QBC47DRAFT_369427 [Echria macrotheca]|uniref:Uncharacterized protein n=1 Tax=Echria macrotheca TaxID=438768 RepID=A0AAJ0FBL6_9PEZI|nr:hypothetical protein QBC47DRAFT_369427 [Echria macrotheca]
MTEKSEDPTYGHLQDLKEFASRLNAAASTSLANKDVYSKVVSLVTCWSPHIRQNDRPHIAAEARSLHNIFNDEYNFSAHFLELTDDDPKGEFRDAFWDAVKEARPNPKKPDEASLFIFYYGGHADAPQGWSGKQWFSPSRDATLDDSVSWDGNAQDLVAYTCDFIFIFDCCYAGAMFNPQWNFRRKCEVLASSSPNMKTAGTKENSFTRTLVSILEKAPKEKAPWDLVQVHQKLADAESMGLRRLDQDPMHYFYSRPTKPSILLHKVRDMTAADVRELEVMRPTYGDGISNARILFKVTFEDHQHKPILREWEQAIRHLPLDKVKHLQVAADAGRDMPVKDPLKMLRMYCCFETRSSTAIMSMPLWLWAYLEPDPAYEAITIIRSEDKLPMGFRSAEDVAAAVPSPVPQLEETRHVIGTKSIMTENPPAIGRLPLYLTDPEASELPPRRVYDRRFAIPRGKEEFLKSIRAPPDSSKIRVMVRGADFSKYFARPPPGRERMSGAIPSKA